MWSQSSSLSRISSFSWADIYLRISSRDCNDSSRTAGWTSFRHPSPCFLLPLSQLIPLSSPVQILSNCHFKVRCDLCLAPGWYTIKALLGPNQGHTKITGTSWRLTSCLPSFKLLYLCHCPSISLSHSLTLSLSLSFFLFLLYLLAVVLPPSLGLISLSF